MQEHLPSSPPQALDSELLDPSACPCLLLVFFFSVLPLKNIERSETVTMKKRTQKSTCAYMVNSLWIEESRMSIQWGQSLH